ncbi:MAG TPA: sugar isomerase domain-containing protein [Acidimicrobiia bacterium]|jgi:uncharacterized phosphosugar-binding protein
MSEAGEAIRAHLRAVEDRNADTLAAVVERVYQTITDGGLILTTGTGHSRAMVLETFYRAGGLACVKPISHPALDPLAGGAASTRLERVTGLGRLLADEAGATDADTAFVFSNSGTNPVPVELAEALADDGATVVAVSSRQHMARAPLRAEKKLDQVAHYVLDTGTPYGDAFWPTPSGDIAPLSSITGAFLWNLILVGVSELAEKHGTTLPVWASANVSGGEERNVELRERYRGRIPGL